MALADTEFDEKEIAVLYQIAADKGVDRSAIDNIILKPATIKFKEPESVEQKIEYLYDYARMILADGIVTETEMSLFKKFCLMFQFKEENIPGITELLIEAAKNQVPLNEIINFVTQNA
jgi:uncharacterized tellurite resistance protein B-like protein